MGGPTSPLPGWYPDPSGAPGQRYWDGRQWTDHRVAPPPAEKGSDLRIVLVVVGVVVAAFVLIGVVVAVGNSGSESSRDTASSTSSAPAPPTAVTLPGRPIPPSPGEAYKIGGFGNSWLPGIYEAPGAAPGGSCSWVVQRDLVGDASSIITQGRGAPGQRVRVGLREGQYFTSDGCGTWQRVGRI